MAEVEVTARSHWPSVWLSPTVKMNQVLLPSVWVAISQLLCDPFGGCTNSAVANAELVTSTSTVWPAGRLSSWLEAASVA